MEETIGNLVILWHLRKTLLSTFGAPCGYVAPFSDVFIDILVCFHFFLFSVLAILTSSVHWLALRDNGIGNWFIILGWIWVYRATQLLKCRWHHSRNFYWRCQKLYSKLTCIGQFLHLFDLVCTTMGYKISYRGNRWVLLHYMSFVNDYWQIKVAWTMTCLNALF